LAEHGLAEHGLAEHGLAEHGLLVSLDIAGVAISAAPINMAAMMANVFFIIFLRSDSIRPAKTG
jgi:hypothetical protein